MITSRVDEIKAPNAWRCIDFLSDVHLDALEVSTFEAWKHYLQHTPADALFILGDLFEVWVGDDTPEPFAKACIDLLESVSQRISVFVMHGNRDFLLGAPTFASSSSLPSSLPHSSTPTRKPYAFQIISDPCVLALPETRFLLSHGDAWCLEDTEYQQFRATVRSDDWQREFLQKSWNERAAIGQAMRQQSLSRHAQQTVYADVDHTCALQALVQNNCSTLIHGHTHRPATHVIDSTHERRVLSDWHAQSQPPRLEVLRWQNHPQKDNAPSPVTGLERISLVRD